MDLSVGSDSSLNSTLVSVPVKTPRRKLSMNTSGDDSKLESTPTTVGGGGCLDSFNDSGFKSLFSTPPSSGVFRSPDEEVHPPLSEISNHVQPGWRSRKAVRETPSEGLENLSPSPFFKFPRPSSLPALSSPFDFSSPRSVEARPLVGVYNQISSPMGRMSLQSPTNCYRSQGSQSSSRPSSTTSESEYLSEVFAGEMEEPVPSAALSTLLSSAPTPMTSRFSGKMAVRPTPVRPSSYHPGDRQPPQFDDTRSISSQRRGSLKRRSPMSGLDIVHQSKRRPLPFTSSVSQDAPSTSSPSSGNPPLLLRSQSCCYMSLSPGSGEEETIGDDSKPFALPLVREGNQSDLKYISPKTLSDLLEGKYDDKITSYSILDCRYPYEYKGGHVRGAINVWTQEQLMEMLFSEPLQLPKEGERQVFVLHCEFSSKRGPKMSRFLREIDRKKNGRDGFPNLYYPELYLLEHGYKAFYAEYPEMCEPQAYCPMDDKNHLEELRTCKQRSKSWTGETHSRCKPLGHHRHSTTGM